MKTSNTSMIIAPLALLLLLATSTSGLRTHSSKSTSAYEKRQQKRRLQRNKRLGNYASYVATGCSGSDCGGDWSGGGDWQGGNWNDWSGGNWNPSWNHHRHHNWHGGGWSHSYCYWNGNQYNIGDRGEYCGSCEYSYCYCVEDESGGSPYWGQCYD